MSKHFALPQTFHMAVDLTVHVGPIAASGSTDPGIRAQEDRNRRLRDAIAGDPELLELYALRDAIGHIEILADEHPYATEGLFDAPGWDELSEDAQSILSSEDRRFFARESPYDLAAVLSGAIFVADGLGAVQRAGAQRHESDTAHQDVSLEVRGTVTVPEPSLERTSAFLYPSWNRTDSVPAQVARETARLARIRTRLISQPSLIERGLRVAPLQCLASSTLRPLLGVTDRRADEDAANHRLIQPLTGEDRDVLEWAITNKVWSENTEPLMEATTATFHKLNLTFHRPLTPALA